MTIEHVVACDGCGTSTPARPCGEGTGRFHAPDDWVDVGHEGEILHFCSWVCVGTYVTQKMREEAVLTQES